MGPNPMINGNLIVGINGICVMELEGREDAEDPKKLRAMTVNV